jgi:hypothetical protein
MAQALDTLSGALLRTINFDTVALFLNRGAPIDGQAWYLLSRNSGQFTAQQEPPPEGEIGLLTFERNAPVQSSSQVACAVPLTTPRGSLGSITFLSRQQNAYPDEEVRFLTLVGAQLGLIFLSLMHDMALRRCFLRRG